MGLILYKVIDLTSDFSLSVFREKGVIVLVVLGQSDNKMFPAGQ